MNLNEGRKIVTQMEKCFEKLKLTILSENERIMDNQNDSHIEITTHVNFEDVDNIILKANLFFNVNLIEISLFLHLDNANFKRYEIIHLLNQINLWRSEGHWSVCDCCDEIEFRYGTLIDKSLPEKYFKQMIRKTIYLGQSFYPLILKQIRYDKNPYELAYEYYLENTELQIADFGVSFDDICYSGPNSSTNLYFEKLK